MIKELILMNEEKLTIDTISDRLTNIENNIPKLLEEIEILNYNITKNTIEINKLENEQIENEFDIRMNANWSDLGIKNKEERELYVKNHDDYKKNMLQITDLENEIAEYKHSMNVAEKMLKFYNRGYDRYSNLELAYYKMMEGGNIDQ